MRKLDGIVAKGMYVYVLAMGLFHLYTAVFGAFEAYLQRSIHLTWVLPMCFVLYPFKTRKKDQPVEISVPWYDWILAILSTLPGLYSILNYDEIMMRMQGVDDLTMAQLVLGTMLIVLLLEATRRLVGLPLVFVALFFTVYTVVCDSPFMPEMLRGVPTEFPRLIEGMFLTDEGIFSSSLGVSATFVMIFLIFGGFLEKSGVGEYFMEFAQAFTGTAPGGPAKIAVLSSALFGSISGSAVANVYGTGSFTIPLMKRIGYSPYFSGAVEAVASTGGQIMPPVMGAGAFVMAALLGVPFNTIMIAALLPAFLYYGTVLLMVHLTAVRDGLKGLPADELPSIKSVLKRLYMMAPIVLLVYMLLAGYTPMYGAIAGISLAWGVSLLTPGKRMGPKRVLQAIHDGSENIPLICTACASAGLVLGSIAASDAGFKFVGAGIRTEEYPFLALIISVLLSIVNRNGTAYYQCLHTGSSTGRTCSGQDKASCLAAHLFVFYYAIISNITPHCGSRSLRCGINSGFKSEQDRILQHASSGSLAFVVPFAFCYDPGLLLKSSVTGNMISIINWNWRALSEAWFLHYRLCKGRIISTASHSELPGFLLSNIVGVVGHTAFVIVLFLLSRKRQTTTS